ncbi:MAG: hypothetical protein ACFFG0_50370, partial [Candidatus Thorarchaeota archaeon]
FTQDLKNKIIDSICFCGEKGIILDFGESAEIISFKIFDDPNFNREKPWSEMDLTTQRNLVFLPTSA